MHKLYDHQWKPELPHKHQVWVPDLIEPLVEFHRHTPDSRRCQHLKILMVSENGRLVRVRMSYWVPIGWQIK